jgi:hypothetical protein
LAHCEEHFRKGPVRYLTLRMLNLVSMHFRLTTNAIAALTPNHKDLHLGSN